VRVLLDTATFLWVVSDAAEFSEEARATFADPENDIYLSSVSVWEIAVKYALGKLPLPEPPGRFVPLQRKQHGIDPLQLDEEAALHLSRLPLYIRSVRPNVGLPSGRTCWRGRIE
jgi:PIN domain nuclease of toxin-antitoxin system